MHPFYERHRHGRRPPSSRNAALALGSFATFLLAGPALPFEDGELYLLSSWLPGIEQGILRIDPLTGQTSVLADLPYATETLTYDPHRARLLLANPSLHFFVAVNDAGQVEDVAPGVSPPNLVAARGDGTVYLWYYRPEGVQWLDADNQVHDLLDVDGVTRFGFGQGIKLNEMIYDPTTNALVCFQGTFDGVTIASCSDPNASCAVRVPLDATGTRVVGAPQAAQADVSGSFERVVGAGLAPGGVLWTIDTNSNDEEPRMQFLDTGSMTTSAFASNGPYIGAAATNAGCYSHVRGQAVIVDTFDNVLRAFAAGERGGGTAFAAGVSGTGAGEAARLIEIAPSLLDAPPEAPSPRPLVRVSASPNPTDAGTEVAFELPGDTLVRMAVYDAAGRLVRELAGGARRAGIHRTHWDGHDDSGARAAAGVYFVRIETDRGSASQKLVLKQ